MTRNRASAKAAGSRFERAIADCLAAHVDDRIEDIAKLALSGWVNEADIERGNDDALVGLVIHKRRGQGDPLDQYVTCTVRDLVALLTGERP
jgi:hypothetical protein